MATIGMAAVALLVVVLLSVCQGRGLATVVSYEPLCPVSCRCQLETHSISCQEKTLWESTWHDIKVISEKLQVEVVEYRGEIPGIPREVQALRQLRRLSLAHSRLLSLGSQAFQGMSRLEELNLNYTGLEKVARDAFAGLTAVHTIRLSGNRLSTLPEGLFEGLTGLRTLILSDNELVTLPRLVFLGLGSLEVLDLSRNRLTFLSAEQVGPLSGLKSLYVNHNRIPAVHGSVAGALQSIKSLTTLDFSDNPWDCSCSLAPLLELIRSPNRTFQNLDRTRCSLGLDGQPLDSLVDAQLECQEPAIESITNDSLVYHRNDKELHCRAAGLPQPAVVWEAPWGQLFAHPSSLAQLGDLAFNTTPSRSYSDNRVWFVSTIAARENGVLDITNFRSAFRGNFTCHAISFAGNDTALVDLSIDVHIKDIYYMSLFLSFGSSGAFLVLGIIIGGLKVLVMHLRKCCRQEKEEEEEEEKKKPESIVTLDEIEVFPPDECKHNLSDYKDDPGTPPAPAVLTSDDSTPNTSPLKCPTPAEDIPTGWIPSNIVETLEEVRGRLRYGVERKMERVRSHVKSIKESGSSYVHNIRESGIQAADRVKAGVVLGVESLKFTAQSFKEFCGTGDMGGQTISMVSVSTDIDTSERTEVVKTVTFV